MKYFRAKLTTIVFILAFVSACGSGGGGGGSTSNGGGGTGDTMTVSVWSLSTSTTTTTYAGNAYDPLLTALTDTTNNKTYIDMGSGYNFFTSSWAKTLSLAINGTTAGVYSFPTVTAPTGMFYTDNILYGHTYQGTSGTITITSIGNIGAPVTGAFNATLATDPTHTIGMSGSFSVTRTQ